MLQMRPRGIVALVGAISQYSSFGAGVYLKSYLAIILNRLSLVGFTLFDYPDLVAETESKLIEALKEGKFVLEGAETVVDVKGKVDEIPRVWSGLFSGSNTGKLITKLAE